MVIGNVICMLNSIVNTGNVGRITTFSFFFIGFNNMLAIQAGFYVSLFKDAKTLKRSQIIFCL